MPQLNGHLHLRNPVRWRRPEAGVARHPEIRSHSSRMDGKACWAGLTPYYTARCKRYRAGHEAGSGDGAAMVVFRRHREPDGRAKGRPHKIMKAGASSRTPKRTPPTTPSA